MAKKMAVRRKAPRKKRRREPVTWFIIFRKASGRIDFEKKRSVLNEKKGDIIRTRRLPASVTMKHMRLLSADINAMRFASEAA